MGGDRSLLYESGFGVEALFESRRIVGSAKIPSFFIEYDALKSACCNSLIGEWKETFVGYVVPW